MKILILIKKIFLCCFSYVKVSNVEIWLQRQNCFDGMFRENLKQFGALMRFRLKKRKMKRNCEDLENDLPREDSRTLNVYFVSKRK